MIINRTSIRLMDDVLTYQIVVSNLYPNDPDRYFHFIDTQTLNGESQFYMLELTKEVLGKIAEQQNWTANFSIMGGSPDADHYLTSVMISPDVDEITPHNVGMLIAANHHLHAKPIDKPEETEGISLALAKDSFEFV